MTERQGRLVSKIQGYEGKDQKTSESLSSVCSWVPRRENEASKRWEESWWWGDRSRSSPGQWQNSNYRQWWHVMESFTLQLYRKRSGQNTCINTLCDRRNRERKEERHPLPLPHLRAYAIRSEDNPMQEKQRDVSSAKGNRALLSWVCGGQAVPVSWMVLRSAPGRASLPLTQQSLQESQISAGCCQQWSRDVCIYLNL